MELHIEQIVRRIAIRGSETVLDQKAFTFNSSPRSRCQVLSTPSNDNCVDPARVFRSVVSAIAIAGVGSADVECVPKRCVLDPVRSALKPFAVPPRFIDQW